MISKKMAAALNAHLNKELYSAYLYVSMEGYANSTGLKGFAHWFNIQVQEELIHARKSFNSIIDQGEKVVLDAIEKPKSDFKSPLDLFETTLEHEKNVTARVNDLVTLANEERDYASATMLQWFVTEQVEEEANVNGIIQQLKLIGNDGSGLFLLDKELGTRVLSRPN